MKTSNLFCQARNNILTILNENVWDMCVAMNDWVQNPTAHTALDDILPCLDNATAQATLSLRKEVTCQLLVLMNKVISNVSNGNIPHPVLFQPLYYNHSGLSSVIHLTLTFLIELVLLMKCILKMQPWYACEVLITFESQS